MKLNLLRRIMLVLTTALALYIPASGAKLLQTDWAAAGPNGYIVATTQACPEPTRSKIVPQYQDSFHLFRAQLEGTDIQGCWAVYGEDAVFLLFEDGTSMVVPQAMFHKLKEA